MLLNVVSQEGYGPSGRNTQSTYWVQAAHNLAKIEKKALGRLRNSVASTIGETTMSIRLLPPVTVAALVFGLASPLVAASNVSSYGIVADAPVFGAAGNAPGVAAVTSPRHDVDIGIRPMPRQAPIGHRQPKVIDVPGNMQLSPFEAEQRRLDAELNKKLVICRGC
jgi:hypothetical protein